MARSTKMSESQTHGHRRRVVSSNPTTIKDRSVQILMHSKSIDAKSPFFDVVWKFDELGTNPGVIFITKLQN
ncbi:hypothetical protein TNCV_2803651 [Trichonephila clavipes]|nr:hypothetical protein TNCV_2803651 [Trichonephila clavipes]